MTPIFALVSFQNQSNSFFFGYFSTSVVGLYCGIFMVYAVVTCTSFSACVFVKLLTQIFWYKEETCYPCTRSDWHCLDIGRSYRSKFIWSTSRSSEENTPISHNIKSSYTNKTPCLLSNINQTSSGCNMLYISLYKIVWTAFLTQMFCY